MQNSITVVTPAEDFALLTVRDARLGLNLTTASDTIDEQIDLFIKWASDEIATECNRTLAQEEVVETIWNLDSERIFLERYPIKEIKSVSENGSILSVADYNLDKETGKLTRLGSLARGLTISWKNPIIVNYIGGYDLPKAAPKALSKAAMMITREAYYAMLRGDISVRMISHKESRIIYFDPNAHLGKTGGGGGSSTKRAVQDILSAYTRYVV